MQMGRPNNKTVAFVKGYEIDGENRTKDGIFMRDSYGSNMSVTYDVLYALVWLLENDPYFRSRFPNFKGAQPLREGDVLFPNKERHLR